MTHEIKTRPILMNGAMVRATLSGAKTQTRRLCKNLVYGNGTWNIMAQDFLCHNDYLPPSAMLMDYKDGGNTYTTSDMEGWDFCCPHGKRGDGLYVRETHAQVFECDIPSGRPVGPFGTSGSPARPDWKSRYVYLADGEMPPVQWHHVGDKQPVRWTPSIHMPRAASRITLEITDVRVERLHDISTEDIIAEGLSATLRGYDAECDLRDQWRKLWELTGGDWDSNPWLWVINFAKVKA